MARDLPPPVAVADLELLTPLLEGAEPDTYFIVSATDLRRILLAAFRTDAQRHVELNPDRALAHAVLKLRAAGYAHDVRTSR